MELNKTGLWAVTFIFAVITVIFNFYICMMSVLVSKQHKHWCPSEIITMALSMASLGHQLVCYVEMTMDKVDYDCRISPFLYAVLLHLVYSLKFTIMWDTSFLTFFYSTKLVSTPNHCYTQIQAAILRHVTMAVLVIPLLGLGTCMPMLGVFHFDNITRADKDCGIMTPDTHRSQIYLVMYLLLSDVLPGIVMVKCCISISVHLAIHLYHMKASTNGSHCPKLGTQMRVIRMALALVAIFITFLIVDLFVNYQIDVNHENAIGLSFLFTSIYTSITAIVLVYGKKTMWKSLLHDFNGFLDEYPALSFMKVPEHKTKHSVHAIKANG